MASHPRLAKKVFHIKSAVDISNFLLLVPNFITISEEEAIIQFLGPKLQRRRYESGHWDNVIHKYKETEIMSHEMPDVISKTVDRFSNFIRESTRSSKMKFMQPHVLDLSSDGHIGRWCLLIPARIGILSQCRLHGLSIVLQLRTTFIQSLIPLFRFV